MVKTPTLFFGLAVLLGLAWAGVEFLTYKSSNSGVVKSCEFTNSTSPQRLSRKNILGLDGQLLWAFDPNLEKILKYRVSSDKGVDPQPLDEVIQYKCGIVDKNCPPAGAPFYFQSNGFLFQSGGAGSQNVYPAHLTGSRMNSRMAIRLCGQTVGLDPSSYHVNSEKILFFDRSKGLLGVWNLSKMSGAFANGSTQEPEKIYRVKSGVGFEVSSCDGRGESPNSFVRFSDKELLLVSEGREAVETYSYAVDDKLTPLKVSQLSQRGVDFLKGSLAMAKAINYNDTTLLTLQSRYFLAPLRFSLIRNDQTYEFPSISWTVRRSAIPHFGSIERNKNEGWIYYQDNEDIVFNEFKCSE